VKKKRGGKPRESFVEESPPSLTQAMLARVCDERELPGPPEVSAAWPFALARPSAYVF